MLVKANTQDKGTSTAAVICDLEADMNNPSSMVIKPGSRIESDPQFYKYHPKSSLALGRTFNHANVSKPMRPALKFTEYKLDSGSPSTHFSMQFVTNENQLDIAISLDSKVEASYLAAKASGSSTFSMGYKIKSDSIVVVANVYKDFGRYALKEDACLIPEAEALLGAPATFVDTFGDRYVSIERRGASASVIISIDSVANDLRIEFKNEFSGSGGSGPLSASAKLKFEALFNQAVKQSRISVEAVSTGGDDISKPPKLIKGLKGTETAIDTIEQVLSDFLAQFTSDKGVPIEYNVAPLSQFGLDESKLDLWTDDKERELVALVRDYRLSYDVLDAIPTLRDGSHILNRLMPAYKDVIEWIVSCEDQIKRHIKEVVENHTALKNNKLTNTIQFPAAINQYSTCMDYALTPPYLDFGAPLTDAQIRVVLRARRGDRARVAKDFDPALVGIGLLMGVSALHYRLFTATEFVRYSDGEFRTFQEFAYDGFGSALWYMEPNPDSLNTDEDIWVQWFAKHTGKFKLTAGLIIRDIAERSFEIGVFDAEFEAQNGTILSLKTRYYF